MPNQSTVKMKAVNSVNYVAVNGSEQTYIITVYTNNPPVATNQTVTTDEDTARNITLAGTDTNNDTLTYSVVTQPSRGVLSGSTPNLIYTPNANFHGNDSFTFKTNDGIADSNPATVSITVNSVDDPATIAGDTTGSGDEDTQITGTLTATDAADGLSDGTYFTVTTAPTNGTASIEAASGVWTYTPTLNYHGSDSFTVTITDDDNHAATQVISLTIAAVDDAPIATAQSVTIAEDTAVAITLAGTDVDNDTLTYAVVAQPSSGTLSGTGPNQSYTPNSNYNGEDSFTFKVNDGQADSNAGTVTITVSPVNDAPVAINSAETTIKNSAKQIMLQSSDIDGDALTFAIISSPSSGTLSTISGDIATYTPNTDYVGSDSFDFKVNDGTLDSNTATVTIVTQDGGIQAPRFG